MAEKKLQFDQARQIALVMESADSNVSDIAACSNVNIPAQHKVSHIERINNPRPGKKTKTVKATVKLRLYFTESPFTEKNVCIG